MLSPLLQVDLTGRRAGALLEDVGITVNKNLIPFDSRPLAETSGICIGSPALTSRAMRAPEMERICDLIHRTLAHPDDAGVHAEVHAEVRDLCEAFPLYERSYHM